LLPGNLVLHELPWFVAAILRRSHPLCDSLGGRDSSILDRGVQRSRHIQFMVGKGTMVVSVPEPVTLLTGFLSLATILGVVAGARLNSN
jgi:hypothetical protein